MDGISEVINMEIPEEDSIDSKLNDLKEERSMLEKASEDPLRNKDYIFSKYENSVVKFDIYVGKDYHDRKNLEAYAAINCIFNEYAKLESPDKEDTQHRTKYQLRDMLENDKQGFELKANFWRLGIKPIYDENDQVNGFRARFFHNLYFPKKNTSSESDIKSHLRYRIALNEIETMLVKENIQYKVIIQNE